MYLFSSPGLCVVRCALELPKVAMKEAKRQEAIGARAAREAKLAQKAANEMRATVVQTISKTHKLKVRRSFVHPPRTCTQRHNHPIPYLHTRFKRANARNCKHIHTKYTPL